MSKLRRRYLAALDCARELGVERQLVELAERACATFEAAADRYDAIRWGRQPDAVIATEAPSVLPGETVAVLGRLEYVEYLGHKGDGALTLWMHPFEAEKPLLCVNAEGKLLVCGGDYYVDERGIVG